MRDLQFWRRTRSNEYERVSMYHEEGHHRLLDARRCEEGKCMLEHTVTWFLTRALQSANVAGFKVTEVNTNHKNEVYITVVRPQGGVEYIDLRVINTPE